MPIFHNPETTSTTASPSISTSSESSSTENAHGLPQWRHHELTDIEMSGVSPPAIHTYDRPFSPLPATDRAELIQSIKRRESPAYAWHLESKSVNHSSNSYEFSQSWSRRQKDEDVTSSKAARQDISGVDEKTGLAQPSEIERPRSALHSGDFREGATQTQPPEFSRYAGFDLRPQGTPSFKRFSSSPTTPWFNHAASSRFIPRSNEATSVAENLLGARSRAPSLGSFSSSYVLKAPTSPLVYQANNSDLDFSPKQEHAEFSTFSNKSNRRRTLPPETFMQLRDSPPNQPFTTAQGGEDLCHQAYQPHRSSTYSLQPASSPQTPFRLRRPSFASELSPRIHASMVGSYEESILRGRMSTTPSKPLDFTAKIGVLGKGKCKSNLRCPPHITVPFPAVFYSYPTSGAGRSISDDSPSPYVGLIDLENSLPRERSSGSKQHPHGQKLSELPGGDRSSAPIPSSDVGARQRHERRLAHADASKTPPGGAYRIPQRGQLQIVIKNPNKTAVKLFLVPYDLDDMEPGTKTFIRQRSYSAGPIIDMPLTARKNLGTDRPEASLNPTNDPRDKPTLRYLIHLNICCPARGRFYLYSTVRVVFANRVPDGKEKLRNEIQYPEPRYSPYKPYKDSTTTLQRSTSDKNHRRRSAGIGFAGNQFFQDSNSPPFPQHSPPTSSKMQVQPVPFKLSIPKSRASSGDDVTPVFSTGFWQSEKSASMQSASEDMSLDSPPAGSASRQSPDDMEPDNGEELYNKLQNGVSVYGSGYPSSSAYSSPGESLLAQRLKDWNCKNEESRRGN